tara:strand:+ start:167 stop:628 length:462 start_codon:yes stop_codon:yes gene_type:complete
MIKIELKEEFTNALKSHDWLFDFSDDHSVWTRGRDEKASLVAMGKQLVSSEEMTSGQVANLWNEFSPERFRVSGNHFDATPEKPRRAFVNRPPRPSMGQVVTLKKELNCTSSEANFRLTFGVEPSETEREIAESNGGRFILHFPSHPEIWEWV